MNPARAFGPAVVSGYLHTGTFGIQAVIIIIIGKGSPYSIAERRVPELIPVLGSQSAGDVSHKPGGRLPLLSARPAVTTATLKLTTRLPSQ